METNKQREITKDYIIIEAQTKYNNYQEYRKEHNQSHRFITKTTIEEFLKTLPKEHIQIIADAYLQIELLQNKLYAYNNKESKLNNAYGKETIHYSELSTEEIEVIQQLRNKKQEYKQAKQQDNLLTKKHITEKNNGIKENLINNIVKLFPTSNLQILNKYTAKELQEIYLEELQAITEEKQKQEKQQEDKQQEDKQQDKQEILLLTYNPKTQKELD